MLPMLYGAAVVGQFVGRIGWNRTPTWDEVPGAMVSDAAWPSASS